MGSIRVTYRLAQMRLLVWRALEANAMFLFFSAIYIALAFIVSFFYETRFSLAVYNAMWIGGAVFVFIIAFVANKRRDRFLTSIPFLSPGEDRRGRLLLWKRLAVAAPVFLVLPLFVSAFTSLKASIGAINPYALDHVFMEVDRFLHGGVSVWRILHPVFGYPLVTAVISFLYEAWFPIMAFTVFAVTLWTERPALRNQFLIAFILTWAVLGTFAALILSSAGPCFYGLMFPYRDNPYAPLMTYLQQADEIYRVRALDMQDLLWEQFEAGDLRPGGGISATPSMHVAISTLLTLLAWRVSRWLGIAATLFLLVTLVATVHLGWHYAIDGYISLAVVPAIWAFAGRVAEFNLRGVRIERNITPGVPAVSDLQVRDGRRDSARAGIRFPPG
ncbi:MAG: phosphatase PAP2 family protein [Salinarimonas sp.]|nr:phosphatase PAP2 family protein [Salinarimonas sp.]